MPGNGIRVLFFMMRSGEQLSPKLSSLENLCFFLRAVARNAGYLASRVFVVVVCLYWFFFFR